MTTNDSCGQLTALTGVGISNLLAAVREYEKHSGFTANNVRALPKNPSRYAMVEAARRDLRWWEQHSNEVEKSLQRGITAMELELGS